MTLAEAAIRIRNLITEQNEASTITLPRIQGAIASMLQNWSRDAFLDRTKRELFKQNFTGNTSAGDLDLTPYIDGTTGRISLHDLRLSTIYVDDIGQIVGKTACTWVNSWQQLASKRPGASKIPAVFLDGSVLRMRTTQETANEGDEDLLDPSESISFTVPSFPGDVSEIPPTLEHDFLMFAVNTLGGAK